MFEINLDKVMESLYSFGTSDNPVTNPAAKPKDPIFNFSGTVGDGFVNENQDDEDNDSALPESDVSTATPKTHVNNNQQVAKEPSGTGNPFAPENQPVAEEPPATTNSTAPDDPPTPEEKAQQMLNDENATFRDINKFLELLDDNKENLPYELKAQLIKKAAVMVDDLAKKDLSPNDPDAVGILNKLVTCRREYADLIAEGTEVKEIIDDQLEKKLHAALGARLVHARMVKLPKGQSNNTNPQYRFSWRGYPQVVVEPVDVRTRYALESSVSCGYMGEIESRQNEMHYRAGAGMTANTVLSYDETQFNIGGYVYGGFRYQINDKQNVGLNVRADFLYNNGVKEKSQVDQYINMSSLSSADFPDAPKKIPYQGSTIKIGVEPSATFQVPHENDLSLTLSLPVEYIRGQRGPEIDNGYSVTFMTTLEHQRTGLGARFGMGLMHNPFGQKFDTSGVIGGYWTIPQGTIDKMDDKRESRFKAAHGL